MVLTHRLLERAHFAWPSNGGESVLPFGDRHLGYLRRLRRVLDAPYLIGRSRFPQTTRETAEVEPVA